jgi:hypothetical protein
MLYDCKQGILKVFPDCKGAPGSAHTFFTGQREREREREKEREM